MPEVYFPLAKAFREAQGAGILIQTNQQRPDYTLHTHGLRAKIHCILQDCGNGMAGFL